MAKPWTRALIALALFLLPLTALAEQRYVLAQVNPKTTRVRAYHSFQNKLLLVVTMPQVGQPIDCRGGRFVFYNYEKETLHQVIGTDLRILDNFQNAFYSEVLSAEEVFPKELDQLKGRLQEIATHLGASSNTLEATRQKSANSASYCWQGAAKLNLNSFKSQSYPVLLANVCSKGICPAFQIQDEKTIDVLAQLEPQGGVWMRLDLSGGSDPRILREVKVLPKRNGMEEHATRDNLIKGPQGEHRMRKVKQGELKLIWETDPEGQLQLALVRTYADAKAGQQIAKKMASLNKSQEHEKALELNSFGHWLDPESEAVRYEKLKSLAFSKKDKAFFKELSYAQSNKDRVSLCRKIRTDKSYAPLWKDDTFSKGFEKHCPK